MPTTPTTSKSSSDKPIATTSTSESIVTSSNNTPIKNIKKPDQEKLIQTPNTPCFQGGLMDITMPITPCSQGGPMDFTMITAFIKEYMQKVIFPEVNKLHDKVKLQDEVIDYLYKELIAQDKINKETKIEIDSLKNQINRLQTGFTRPIDTNNPTLSHGQKYRNTDLVEQVTTEKLENTRSDYICEIVHPEHVYEQIHEYDHAQNIACERYEEYLRLKDSDKLPIMKSNEKFEIFIGDRFYRTLLRHDLAEIEYAKLLLPQCWAEVHQRKVSYVCEQHDDITDLRKFLAAVAKRLNPSSFPTFSREDSYWARTAIESPFNWELRLEAEIPLVLELPSIEPDKELVEIILDIMVIHEKHPGFIIEIRKARILNSIKDLGQMRKFARNAEYIFDMNSRKLKSLNQLDSVSDEKCKTISSVNFVETKKQKSKDNRNAYFRRQRKRLIKSISSYSQINANTYYGGHSDNKTDMRQQKLKFQDIDDMERYSYYPVYHKRSKNTKYHQDRDKYCAKHSYV